MTTPLLLVSGREEDARLAEHISKANGLPLTAITDAHEVRTFLVDNPKAVVFLGADDRKVAEGAGQVMLKLGYPRLRIFAITDEPLKAYPHLFEFPAFGHHLYRRFDGHSVGLYARLAAAAVTPHPFGLQRYFPDGATHQKIVLRKASQKHAAVEAIQNLLSKLKLPSRVASSVAKAVDELIMNALFDAPVAADGTRTRRALPRDSDFELTPKDEVVVELAWFDGYLAVSVSDPFGSLKKDTLLGFLKKDYQEEAYVARRGDPGAGLGLNDTIQSGLSLLFVTKPGVRTEVTVFCPNVRSFKAFRDAFAFLSLIVE